MKIINLGWGVQSFTLAAMVALGELEPVDAALHSDTLHESKLTYEFEKRWMPWLIEHGVNVVIVKNPTGGIWPILDRSGQTHIPAYTLHLNKGQGQLRRSCTHRWKIVPLRRWIQAHRNGEHVEQWIGISTDEALRMKPSDVKYVTHRWPLIEKMMSRDDCAKWLDEHNLEVPPKSACTFCPYHNTAEWRRIQNTPEDWGEATKVDKALRKQRPPYDLFVHPARIPLEEVDLRTAEEKGQLRLWDDECSGICGV